MRKPSTTAPSVPLGRKMNPSKTSPQAKTDPPAKVSRPVKTSPPAKTSHPAKTSSPAPQPKPAVTAVELGARQREISVSEFFTKNRHLLGFDNPRKALLTCVKEGVDNALDACEEAGILPDVVVKVEVVANGETPPPPTQASRFRITVTDNGPGIVRQQIPKIFAKLLYGSKFHRLRMSRGQQGIGISAAGMYGQLTTGKPVQITSRIGPRRRPFTLKSRSIRRRTSLGFSRKSELIGRASAGRRSPSRSMAVTRKDGPRWTSTSSRPSSRIRTSS